MLGMAPTPRILATLTLLTALSLAQESAHPRISYPPTPKDDVVDDYHGTKVPAPYRWMEDLDSKQVTEWVAAENKVTFDYLATLPMRDHFRRRITELWDYPKITIPVHKGERYFYSKNSGLQRQSSLFVRPNLTAPATLVIDPNTLSPDGSISLSQWTPSNDGRLIAYGLPKAARIGALSTYVTLTLVRIFRTKCNGRASPISHGPRTTKDSSTPVIRSRRKERFLKRRCHIRRSITIASERRRPVTC